jgi:hypothetical protein
VPHTDICRHCRYRVPTDATICPGCSRRHEPHPVAAALSSQTALPLARRSPLLHRARWSRRLLVLAGWASVAFGTSALARYTVGLDRVRVRLHDDVPGRLSDVTQRLGVATLVLLALATAATVVWARAAHRNLRPLGLPSDRWSAWSLPGWLLPGHTARQAKASVDAQWRGDSPTLAHLPGTGWSRQPVSRVVLHWWTLWLWVPAVGVVIAVVVDTGVDGAPGLGGLLPLAGVAAAALLVAAVRALYDVVAILTVAQAHRAQVVGRERADLPWLEPVAG